MERCIWIIENEGEFFVCEGYAGGAGTIASGFYNVAAAKATAERMALQASANAVYTTLKPPIGVRDYPRGSLFRPARVLTAGWSWIETDEPSGVTG